MPTGLGNLVFTKSLAENLARPESILTFFHRTVIFGLYEQGLIFLSGYYSPVKKTVCRVVGWPGVGRCLLSAQALRQVLEMDSHSRGRGGGRDQAGR